MSARGIRCETLVLLSRSGSSVAPTGLADFPLATHVCAVGCTLWPLRGFHNLGLPAKN